MGAELIFIPSPGVGHLISTVEIAKLLVSRDQRLSITVLVMKLGLDTGVTTYIQSLQNYVLDRIVFVNLPPNLPQDDPEFKMASFSTLIEIQRPQVRAAVQEIVSRTESNQLAGFVIDMFCTSMIDVADEFGVPAYLFLTSGAVYLCLHFYQLNLYDDHNQELTEYKDSSVELPVPGLANPVIANVLPQVMLDNKGSSLMLSMTRRFQETKAILINTFSELEIHAMNSLFENDNVPTIYPVGPIINFKGTSVIASSSNPNDAIVDWLDNQPPSSVVFLCFGSFGHFEADQVREIALALVQSGHRFLWSLRRPPQQREKMELPKEYENPEEVLPEGFLERTAGIGKVIGWAPQMVVLSHPAVGGFVSHCGWNSTLESIWCGVPMATWPMYAEQQLNAFELVKELGLSVEIKMDYVKDFRGVTSVVNAEVIERGIRSLMDGESHQMRLKMKEMKEKSRMAVAEGGSSHVSLGRFIEDVMSKIHNEA